MLVRSLTMRMGDGTRLVGELEAAEAGFMHAYGAGVSPAVRDRLGVVTATTAGGIMMCVRNDPSRYFNKALGFPGPVTGDLVAEIIEFFRAAGAGVATLQFAPAVLPADWAAIADAHGLTEGAALVKLAGRVEDVRTDARTSLRVAPVTPDDAAAWSDVVCGAFGLGEVAPLMAASVSHPDFRPFAAWDGDTIVGGANLYLHGEVAELNAGGTLAGHRNRGVQSALIAARAEAAREAGCRLLVAETGRPAPGERNPSLSNMLRAGLTERYVRTNWIWRDPSTR